MKFILIPDSFKGTLSSAQICGIIKEKVDLHFPGAESVSVPVADGGEGSVDAFITAVGGTKVMVPVKGPYFEDIESYYGLIDNGNTAVIEMSPPQAFLWWRIGKIRKNYNLRRRPADPGCRRKRR